MKKLALFSVVALLAFRSWSQTTTVDAFAKSYEYEYNQNYTGAISALEKIYSEDKYEIYLRLGWLHYSAGNYTKSVAQYKKAIEKNPESVEAMLGIVNPLAAMGNMNEVVNYYHKILTVDSKNYTVNYRLAIIYYEKKEFSKAKTYAQTVANLYPFDYYANVILGKIYISLGDITQAKQVLNKALLYSPYSEEVKALLRKI